MTAKPPPALFPDERPTCFVCGHPATHHPQPLLKDQAGDVYAWTYPKCDRHKLFVDVQHADRQYKRRKPKWIP